MGWLVRNGRVVDPGAGVDAVLDLRIDGQRIVEVGTALPARGESSDEEIFDADGLVVAPGFIDMHAHLREPGQEAKETIAAGARAAAVGGFTAVAAMPNTKPAIDTQALVAMVLEKGRVAGAAQVLAIGAITKGRQGETLAEISDMRRAGVVAISDDGAWVRDGALMRRAMDWASMLDLLVISHAEDPALAGGGVMNEGFTATRLGLRGMPAVAETTAIARDLQLAELTGARLHIAHVSTRGGVELVRAAKAKGLRVTAEVTPHHLVLTEQDVEGYDTNAKVSPPLRSAEDLAGLQAGLADGTIDVIATDHAPHTAEEKNVEFDAAPFGLVGLETAVPVLLDKLVHPGLLPLGALIERLAVTPARLLGVEGGRMIAGGKADLTLIDLDRVATVDPSRFHSQARNTPFAGWKLRGWPAATFVAGRLVARDGGVVA